MAGSEGWYNDNGECLMLLIHAGIAATNIQLQVSANYQITNILADIK